MATKPTDYIDWMTGTTEPDSAIVEPPDEKKLIGWLAEEKPPYQFFNWFWRRADQWVRFFDKTYSQYDVTIGAGVDCTHATLAAAVADSAVGTNIRVLIRDSATIAATPSLTKAGWKIFARPGVVYTKGAATTAISIAAANVEIRGLRFAGYTVSGDKAIALTAAGDYARIYDCNFAASTDTEVDDASVTAGKKPILFGNFTEI